LDTVTVETPRSRAISFILTAMAALPPWIDLSL
jgi:hypothetical protein